MRQRGACPGFGGSDLEKECESGRGGVPASSAQAVGAGCQAAAAVAATQNSVPVALSQKLGEGVCVSSVQNGTITPSNHLAGETQLAWFPYREHRGRETFLAELPQLEGGGRRRLESPFCIHKDRGSLSS